MLQPKPNIDKLFPQPHGGINYAEISNICLSPETVLDFSTNCNPFGPPPGTQEVIATASIENYPDSEATELKLALAAKLSVPPDYLIIGNGSTELIRLITLAYFGAKTTILIPKPTYGEYEVACHIANAEIIHQSMLERTNLKLSVADTISLITQHQPKGIFLCNPNNPTGQYLSTDEIESILAAAPDSLVVLDEAYTAFTDKTWVSLDLLKKYDNLIILRSMTKDFALAGLRLGYAIAKEPVISTLKRVKPPWNVNAVAQQAGLFVLGKDDYIEECTLKITEAKNYLITELSNMQFKVMPSQTNFFLVKVSNFAFEFRHALLYLGILVRDCTSFGLPHYIRIAPRSVPECKKLIEAIKEFTGNCYAS